MVEVKGTVSPGYEKVAEAFADNFSKGYDSGAACCVFRDGKPVLNIWGGLRDAAREMPWQEDTVQVIFSATKGITTICILYLVEEGKLALDEPIATYWPEFAAEGKEAITLKMLMSHRAGVPVVDGDFTLKEVYSRDPVIEAIAKQKPVWEPGSAHGYHVRTFGWILGEVIRRVTGKMFGEVVQKIVARPLNIPLWVGLPEEEVQRTATLIPPESGNKALIEAMGADSLMIRGLTGPSNLFDYNEMWNDVALLQAEMPSSNGVSNAHALAKVYASLLGDGIDGIRLLRPETVKHACRPLSSGPDSVIIMPSTFGVGFILPPFLAKNCSESSFGHPGAGGSTAFADPEADMSFAYVTSQMRLDPEGDPRSMALLDALYQSV